MSDTRILGIGRPNIELTSDYAGDGKPTWKFNIHMEFPVNPSDLIDLKTELNAIVVKKHRKDLKVKLKNLLVNSGVGTKGGASLIDGIADDPKDDGG